MYCSRRLIVKTLVFSHSYLRSQVSPPETVVVKGGTTWARNGQWMLPENARLPRSIEGSFTFRKSTTWDKRLYFPSEGRRAEDFFALKNPTASAGVEPANLGTKGQHATSRPPKPLNYAYYKALTVRLFPSCYMMSQEMFQLPILKLPCSERTRRISVTRGLYSSSLFYMWYKWIYMYLCSLTEDRIEQFPESQHPIPFASNTGCSLRLDTHTWDLKWQAKKIKLYTTRIPTPLPREIARMLSVAYFISPQVGV